MCIHLFDLLDYYKKDNFMLKFKLSFALLIFFTMFSFIIVLSCKEEKNKETITEGTMTIYTDETLMSIVEDQVAVFESQYKAKITQINKSEAEVVNSLITGKSDFAVLSRRLTVDENKAFDNKKIRPRVTKFASDAIVFISNKSSNDTVVDLQEVINFIQGKSSKIKSLVFDNPNSSNVKYLDSLSGVSIKNNKNVYSLGSHEEVLKYVSDNTGVIGVTGLNSIVQPYPKWETLMDKIKVMGVKNVKTGSNNSEYYKPTQANLGKGLYPLRRDIYVLNCQGSARLGTGFASFLAGDIGQRIILTSGLLPVRIPERIIITRNQIMNNK